MSDFRYWKPRPRRFGVMWWALLIPAIVYSAGVIVYAHAAFSPADIADNGHAIGSALMVIGGEAGTLAAASAVFQKSRIKTVERNLLGGAKSEATALDWLGLFVSLVATLGNLFVVYAALTELSDAWVADVRSYGPLVLLLCSGLDFYANVMEFGFYNASFDERIEAWLLARHNAEMRWERERAPQSKAPMPAEQPPDPAYAEHSEDVEEEAVAESYVCEDCGRSDFATQQALNAHKRFCPALLAEESEDERD